MRGGKGEGTEKYTSAGTISRREVKYHVGNTAIML